jgi:mannan endo-1,4-beta-mannosidase
MKNPRATTVMLAILFPLITVGCTMAKPAVSTPTPTKTATPVPPTATTEETVSPAEMDARRTEVLAYIARLSAGPFAGVISGQNCYHGNEILQGYQNLVVKLHNQSGQWVGILGVDYEYMKAFRPDELSAANNVLIDYARAGGLIAVTLTPQNPWANDESDLVNNPGSWNGPSASESQAGIAMVTSLDDLIDSTKPVHAAWMRKLDRIAAALQELRDAGVVVLFRPMQEMNGSWVWWGITSHLKDPSPYARVYRHMHDYFTYQKGLNNLIWVYSPSSSFGQNDSSTVVKSVKWAYPGDSYVDVVAGTNYADDMEIVDYAAYVSMGKPLGFGEYGPTMGGTVATNGTWDTSQIIVKFKTKYPRIAFWVSWHSYPQLNWSLIANTNAATLLNDPNVINRDDFTWSWLE